MFRTIEHFIAIRYSNASLLTVSGSSLTNACSKSLTVSS
jgi:hypothetical protein